jgi:hypothetical protein
MRTDKQKEASKTNGAKSNGPVTPEGKANSSQNGMRHNLSSGHVVLLSNEDPDEFIEFSFGFLDRFAPADPVERDLVNQMIAASWRLARISAIECSLVEIEMDNQRAKLDREYSFLDAHARQTLSIFGNVDKETAMRMLFRYQSAAGRAYSRALRMLKELQGDRFGRRPAEVPPVAPEQNQDRQESETSKPNQDRQGVEPASSYAPKIIVFNRRGPENTKLQSEPGHRHKSDPPAILKAMCA